jgi:hypothetical protein
MKLKPFAEIIALSKEKLAESLERRKAQYEDVLSQLFPKK